ncbi:MAG TPA: adenosine kinase [Mariniphaga anaerophila]|uniref:Adenosine kinase n=1 Tax=Mariniphaga anaerophila TaxID=1484053 RepID=A0A831PN42_9BACT|nr:adenosine kinase [Mariniphaga anaerophila]
MNEIRTSILGIGNALVDVIIALENDTVLAKFGLPRGSMTLVDAELSRNIYKATRFNNREITTGGSAANTIHALAALGTACGYLGKTGNDELGDIFRREFEKKNIKTFLLQSEKGTGRVMAMVSPDSERTMATYLGAAADLKPEELKPEMFEGFGVLYVEGYLVQDHRLIETAVDLARQAKLKIAIDLSSFNIVEQNLAFLRRLTEEKVDIVFANEEEAFAFTGKKPDEALEKIAALCEIAVVKTGKEGSLIQRGNEKTKAKIIPALAIDTTGAGDNYAAGFLYGLMNGFSLQKCGRIAALVSGKVVEVMGAKIPDDRWPAILKTIYEMED